MQSVYDAIIAKVDKATDEIVYFSRGLGIAPGVGDIIGETHISGSLTQTYLYVQNHRGDTVAVVGSSGLEVGSYDYDAWGNVTTQSGVNAWFTFSGKHYDSEARLYYYGFRWYDPEARRWTQEDPKRFADGMVPYVFSLNSPLAHTDSYGHQSITSNDPRCKKCGPDVSGSIVATLNSVRNRYAGLTDANQKQHLCSYSYLMRHWDIAFPGSRSKYAVKGTVAVGGWCYDEWEVNYVPRWWESWRH